MNGYEAGKYWINNNLFDPEDYPEYWEKIKLVAFTTEDGHDVHGEYTLFTVGITTNCDNSDYWKISECKLNFISTPNLIDYKWFYSRGNAEKYIEENKPQYSKKDLLYFVHEGRHYHPSVATTEVISEIIRLKK